MPVCHRHTAGLIPQRKIRECQYQKCRVDIVREPGRNHVKTMAIRKQHEEVRLGGGVLEHVTRFVYLGGLITEAGRCEEDVKRRIGLACAASGELRKMWSEKSISIATKMKLYAALVVR